MEGASGCWPHHCSCCCNIFQVLCENLFFGVKDVIFMWMVWCCIYSKFNHYHSWADWKVCKTIALQYLILYCITNCVLHLLLQGVPAVPLMGPGAAGGSDGCGAGLWLVCGGPYSIYPALPHCGILVRILYLTQCNLDNAALVDVKCIMKDTFTWGFKIYCKIFFFSRSVCERLMIRDTSLIPNILWFEYTHARTESRARNRKLTSMKSQWHLW